MVFAWFPIAIWKLHLNGLAPKYQTAYACEGKKLTIECEPGDLISLIRANYGRFSITICNDHGNVDWSVNCMFPKSLTVLNSRCAHKQSCSVLATTSMFGDPCPGTHKYLEAHYQCISASQTSTTTNRPSPPWVLTGKGNTPPILANSSTFYNPLAAGGAVVGGATSTKQRLPSPGVGPGIIPGSNSVVPGIWHKIPSSPGPPISPTVSPTLPGGRIKDGNNNTSVANPPNHRQDAGGIALPPLPPIQQQHNNHHHPHHHSGVTALTLNNTTPPNTRILTGVGGTGSDDATLLTTKSTQQHFGGRNIQTTTLPSDINGGGGTRTINNINNANAAADSEEANMFCGPINARNLFWNVTRVGDVNVQPCPGGATGIAKWRCLLTPNSSSNCGNGSVACDPTTSSSARCFHGFEPTWHPTTPDLTQCRSLWLNNLEVRVNQRDSSLISIANDLSEVTSSKTLYGGDMLVTTKIIQTMSEKMFHDKETFPDQRQREAIILELLLGVVKTGSNLLDETQLPSWLDLSQEDQMRVASSLLTGLEYNAFLLADTIIRERNVVQKVKNILLAVRVLETKNIQANVVFPDADQWQISDDRIELPRAALLENSEGGLVRIVFAAFDRLESILKPSDDQYDSKSSRSFLCNTATLSNDSNPTDNNAAGGNLQERVRILNSKVISASLGKGRHIQLSQPIKLVLRHLKTENVTNPTCVFWNYIDHAWSANGCNLESTNRTHSICMCNHLTNFALLMDVLDENNHSLFSKFDGNMRVLIYISIGICLVFIIIALLTLKIFNGAIVKSARTSIYRSIYICLLLTEILFLFGIEQSESSVFCGFTTVFIHCAILPAIAWFCFEAFQSYTTLTTDDMLLEVDQTAKVNCYYLLSYALSISIVAVSLVINPSSYTRNDYCVLMEANALFYTTFVTPVLLYFLGAICYTFLASILMCRKSRMALKNKEHTRLANVRFDIRCSFIFLLILSAAWSCAYFYLRRTKADDQNAIIFGYLFIGLNALMGFYIFIFHCIQNEKIRREYRKYVRKNAWLPKCLRCSKTSISSGMGVGGGGGGGMPNATGNVIGAAGAGTISNNTVGSSSSNCGDGSGQIKKSNLHDENEPNSVVSVNAAETEDVIMATSDCELNEAKMRRTLKSGVMPGTLAVQQNNKNNTTAMAMTITMAQSSSGTLRSQKGAHTPSVGHASPTSSVSSTHLIFGHGHKPLQNAVVGGGTHEAFYHHPDYSWKQAQQQSVAIPMQFHSNMAATANNVSPQSQHHEFFYWTQKHGSGNQQGKKKRNNGVTATADSPSGSLHSRTTAASQIIFYPSYKKTTSVKNQNQYAHYAEAIEPTTAFYQQQQQQRRYNTGTPANSANYQHHRQQQQQYLSSDDEPPEAAAAHAHLLHLSRRAAQQQQQPLSAYPQPNQYGPPPEFGATPQRYYRNKHSNCDLNQDYVDDGRDAAETYYNQDSNGPVYEEILSNRNSDVQHYDVDDMSGVVVGNDFDYNQRQQQPSLRNGGVVGGVVIGKNAINSRRNGSIDENSRLHRNIIGDDDDAGDEIDDGDSICDDDDDDEDDDGGLDEEENSSLHGLPLNSDERMRRLMALQDEDFKRRFQRQQRKNAAAAAAAAGSSSTGAYYDYDTQQQQLTQSNTAGFNGIVGSGSVRSFKKTSPNNRINELFNHGPPLPPANAHPMQKRQQQQVQQQQMSPQSTSSSSASSSAAPHIAPQKPHTATRNISAMLDENNTVRCYLEPLNK